MPTDDNDAYGDLDKSNLKFIYEQFLLRRYADEKSKSCFCAASGFDDYL